MTNRLLIVGLLAAASVSCSAKSSGHDVPNTPNDAPITVYGTLVLNFGGVGFSNFTRHGGNGMRCQGIGGFADITAGASVTVRDGSGAIIALGRLAEGRVLIRRDGYPKCDFGFAVTDVPRKPFYEISVSHRNTVDYALADVISDPVKLVFK